MTEKELFTGKKVWIKEMSRPEVKECRKFIKPRYYPDGSHVLEGLADAQDAWIEKGLGGLDEWKAENGEIVPDDIIMRLTLEEQAELAVIIKEVQVLNPINPSHSD